jgi:hypothetical protein
MLGYNVQRTTVTIAEVLISVKIDRHRYDAMDEDASEELVDEVSGVLDRVDFKKITECVLAQNGLADAGLIVKVQD